MYCTELKVCRLVYFCYTIHGSCKMELEPRYLIDRLGSRNIAAVMRVGVGHPMLICAKFQNQRPSILKQRYRIVVRVNFSSLQWPLFVNEDLTYRLFLSPASVFFVKLLNHPVLLWSNIFVPLPMSRNRYFFML